MQHLKALLAQVEAIKCDTYFVYVIGDGHKAQVKKKTKQALLSDNYLSFLKAMNAQGYGISIAPGDSAHSYFLVDDVAPQNVKKAITGLFKPCVVVETSHRNYQMWLRTKSKVAAETRQAIAGFFANIFDGDHGAANANQPGKLCGFYNHKYSPACRINLAALQSDNVVDNAQLNESVSRYLDAVRLDKNHNVDIEHYHLDSPDLHIDDIRYCIAALHNGEDETTIKAHLGQRDLSKKGSKKRQHAYIERTYQKALRYVTTYNH